MQETILQKQIRQCAKGLSAPMLQMLRDIGRHNDAFHSLARRPSHGGATGTTQALAARGLFVDTTELSLFGKQVLAEANKELNLEKARYYVSARKRTWQVIDRTTGLPVYDNVPHGNDAPAIFGTLEAAQECAEYLNETEQ